MPETGILTDIRGDFSRDQADTLIKGFNSVESNLRKSISKTDSALRASVGELEKSQQALLTDFGQFRIDQYHSEQKRNLDLDSLTNTFLSEMELSNAKFEEQMQNFIFDQQKEDLDYRNVQAGLDESYQLTNLGYEKGLGDLDQKAEGIRLLEEYRDQAKAFREANIKGDINVAKGILDSLNRTRGLLQQRYGLVDEIRDINLGVNALQTAGAERKRRALTFGSQTAAARVNAVRNVFFSSVSGVLGAKDLDRESLQTSLRISGAVQQIKQKEFEKQKIFKTALDRKLGIKAQIEGVDRQAIKAKNSVSKLKNTLKENNALRDYQKKAANLALEGVERGKDFILDKKELTGTSYARKKKYNREAHALSKKRRDFSRGMTERIKILGDTHAERSFGLKRRGVEGEYIKSRDKAVYDYNTSTLNRLREQERKRREQEYFRERIKVLTGQLEETRRAKEKVSEPKPAGPVDSVEGPVASTGEEG